MKETEDSIKKRIAQNLRTKRQHKNLTQEKLSDLSGVDISYIGQIERELRLPSIKTLLKISNHLGIALKDMF